LVTGGASGIGRGIVEALTRDGFHCVIASRHPEHGTLDRTTAIAVDITKAQEVTRLFASVEARCGRLDALVNCAGIVVGGRLEAQSDAAIEAQLAVNLFGTIIVTRAALDLLRASKGAVINVGSTLAHRPSPGVSIYAATKGAIEAFTRAMASELASDGVRVHAVLPSLVRSNIWTSAGMSADAYGELLATRAREYPLGRVGEPADVAEMVAYLISEKASWMTGTCIPVDGGAMLGPRRD
jgi:NAD(P)-dependent dehydrogenase (short-subunit alcohol dehydrogenase family)